MTNFFRARVFALQLLCLFAVAFLSVQAQTPQRTPLTGPLGFIENKGQFRDQDGNKRDDLQYMFIRPGMKVQLLPSTISFELFTLEQEPRSISEALGMLRRTTSIRKMCHPHLFITKAAGLTSNLLARMKIRKLWLKK